jgi:hypothetical protein
MTARKLSALADLIGSLQPARLRAELQRARLDRCDRDGCEQAVTRMGATTCDQCLEHDQTDDDTPPAFEVFSVDTCRFEPADTVLSPAEADALRAAIVARDGAK